MQLLHPAMLTLLGLLPVLILIHTLKPKPRSVEVANLSVVTVVTEAGSGSGFFISADGLIVTNMRDQVSWAFYIGNFTFLVGVAAAAVLRLGGDPLTAARILGLLGGVAALVSSWLRSTCSSCSRSCSWDRWTMPVRLICL